MVLDKLGESLKNSLARIARAVFVDEKLVNELIKDIQRALLQADVNVNLVFELTKKIKERALKEELPKRLTKREHLINIVYEELTNFLGKETKKIEIKEKPFKVMMVGLYGSGKTTSIAKLARYYSKRGYKVATIGLDVHRPAAPEQLEQVSKQVHVPCMVNKKEKNPLKIYKKFESELKKYDIVIIDTAGRDALSQDLIKEITELNNLVEPDENLLVISADIGQAAQQQAESFHESCGITGIITTKMDGTAKAGGALTACAATKAPIKFIGMGEKPEDIEEFKPKNFVGRLLGMGDLEALLEKAREAITSEEAEDLGKRFLKGDFNLIDLYEQMVAVRKMGSLSKLVEFIPGFSQLKLPKGLLEVQEGKLEKWKHAMGSMTKEELENPDVLERSRLERIAKGSGVAISDIRELIKQYKQSKKLVKTFKGADSPKQLEKMMKKFKGKLPGI